jgi:rSAM/selenodomain-associated transferase 1
MSREALIIFQKNLELGKVKTRLGKDLGDETALEIFKKLCTRTYIESDRLAQKKFLFYSSFIPEAPEWSIGNSEPRVQKGEDLGKRMLLAISEVLEEGYEKAVLIGTDCPEISTEILEKSFRALDQHEVVLGPAEDGGYYLIGMKQPISKLFENIPWSTEQVLPKTLEILKSKGISYSLLPTLSDLDTLEDWERFKRFFDPRDQ